MTRIIEIDPRTLLILVGVSGSGKTTFARRFFPDTAIVSSDRCRALICDDEGNQAVSAPAFELFNSIIDKRLAFGRTTLADSTALRPHYRTALRDLARKHNFAAVVLAFNVPADVAKANDRRRAHRSVGPAVIDRQLEAFTESLPLLNNEGMDAVYTFTNEQLDDVEIHVRGTNASDPGPFDFIGDVHGCSDELEALLTELGYQNTAYLTYVHPQGRRVVFVGDITDRGPRSIDAFRIVNNMVKAGSALFTPGNHCNKLMRWLRGNNVRVGFGMETTIAEFNSLPIAEREEWRQMVTALVSNAPTYLMLDGGRVVACHAGIKENMIGRQGRDVQSMCLYGDTTGETTAEGLPVRRDWAAEYRGWRFIVYGHTPVRYPEMRNNTINIDQGCAFGGWLTAFRWPERLIVQVPARRVYYNHHLPSLGQEERFGPEALQPQG
jgi:predicted kinase/diadenosine tetraphosphatase ApaH/serine/threonine PP2A family protein phosphatase